MISRIHDKLCDVVQCNHLQFTLLRRNALPRQNFEEYVEEERIQHSFAAPFVDEVWLRAMLLLFVAVVRLVRLEMEQVFCYNMLYDIIYSMLNCIVALTLSKAKAT